MRYSKTIICTALIVVNLVVIILEITEKDWNIYIILGIIGLIAGLSDIIYEIIESINRK